MGRIRRALIGFQQAQSNKQVKGVIYVNTHSDFIGSHYPRRFSSVASQQVMGLFSQRNGGITAFGFDCVACFWTYLKFQDISLAGCASVSTQSNNGYYRQRST